MRSCPFLRDYGGRSLIYYKLEPAQKLRRSACQQPGANQSPRNDGLSYVAFERRQSLLGQAIGREGACRRKFTIGPASFVFGRFPRPDCFRRR